MKKIVLVLALTIAVANLYAQNSISVKQQRIRTREAKYALDNKENYIFVTLATGFSSHNQMMAVVKIEYSSQIKSNWFWGVTLQNNQGIGRLYTYDVAPGSPSPYQNTLYQNIFTLNGMAYYRIPIVKSRLFLRPGVGFGLGYHQMQDHENSKDGINDKVLPYFNAELSWLLRVSKHVDLKFSPTLLFTPQSFAISPMKLGSPTDVIPYHFDAGLNIGVGVRF